MTELAAHYDVVCTGGALLGSSVAYFLTENTDFDGTVLVVEPDPGYEKASSSLSGNSIREQFSQPVNIKMSQFGMEFIADFPARVNVDGEAPDLAFRGTGYLFLATEAGMVTLRDNHRIQQTEGVGARLLDLDELQRAFPYLSVEGLSGASLGSPREGTMEGWALLQGLRRRAIHNGAVYVKDRVVDLEHDGQRVQTVVLASGRRVGCGHVVNTAGPRAALIAAMVDLPLPVEPRRRTTFVIDCRTPIHHPVPLTITPEGVHFCREQHHFVVGGTPHHDPRVDYDDFAVARDEFDEIIWPVLATRVPQFDRISVVTSWAGHYAYNTLDQNAIVGPAPELPNFVFANGFSGHGLQQSPAVGRAVSELIVHGEYRSIDLSELGYERVVENAPFRETVII